MPCNPRDHVASGNGSMVCEWCELRELKDYVTKVNKELYEAEDRIERALERLKATSGFGDLIDILSAPIEPEKVAASTAPCKDWESCGARPGEICDACGWTGTRVKPKKDC